MTETMIETDLDPTESHSYLFGTFCAMLQQMQEIANPDIVKRGFNWASDALILFRTNPESTLQLIEEVLRKFPQQVSDDQSIYMVSDLLVLYQQLGMKAFLYKEVDEDLFIQGYRSKIFDTVETAPVKEEEVPADNPNFLIGSLVAKVQFMDEGTDRNVKPKGDLFVSDVYDLLMVNRESTFQFVEIIIKKLPEYAEIEGTVITLQEILLLYSLLQKSDLQNMQLDKEVIFRGYEVERNRLCKV
ncbi:MAG: hypothetical protein R3Y63_04265 [Eubacteriales bacterium]